MTTFFACEGATIEPPFAILAIPQTYGFLLNRHFTRPRLSDPETTLQSLAER